MTDSTEPIVSEPAAEPATPRDPKTPQTDSEWYWYRQGAKQTNQPPDVAVTPAEPAAVNDLENRRLQAIVDAELPKRLAALVPQGLEDPAAFIEQNILPLREDLRPMTRLGNPTEPARGSMLPASSDDAIATMFRNIEAAGDAGATTRFFSAHRDVLNRTLNRG